MEPRRSGEATSRDDSVRATVAPSEKVSRAYSALKAVSHARDNYLMAPDYDRQRSALRNFVEEGRAVTWALHHLKSDVGSDWATWWADITLELNEDPVAQFFYSLRNPVVKEGAALDTQSNVKLENVKLTEEETPAPANAEYITIVDGQLVWALAGGGYQLVDVPFGRVTTWETIKDIPDDLSEYPLPLLMQRYLCVLDRVVEAAYNRFGWET